MNWVAIDDEPLALDVIEDLAARMPFLSCVGKCTSAFDAIEILQHEAVDLVFLDIQMPHISGLEFIRSIEEKPMVIFTTAYSEYALDGFEVSAVDYLVKPISFDRFLKAVNKAYELYNLKNKQEAQAAGKETKTDPDQDFLMVKVEYKTVRIDTREIKYIEGLKDYVKIYTSAKKPLLTKTTMKHIESRLPAGRFIRIHKSYIISLNAIETIENNRVVIAEKYIPVGTQYKEDFEERLKEFRL